MTNLVTMADMITMANAFAKSNFFGTKTPDQALSLMLIAQAEGLHPAIAARDYDIINGKPAKKSEAIHRSFLQAGGKITWHELNDSKADATFYHHQGGEVRLQWDITTAKKAGLADKDIWKKYPRQMLRNRIISEGVRTVYPMATSGLLSEDEVKDIDVQECFPEQKTINHVIKQIGTETEKPKPKPTLAFTDLSGVVSDITSYSEWLSTMITVLDMTEKEKRQELIDLNAEIYYTIVDKFRDSQAKESIQKIAELIHG